MKLTSEGLFNDAGQKIFGIMGDGITINGMRVATEALLPLGEPIFDGSEETFPIHEYGQGTYHITVSVDATPDTWHSFIFTHIPNEVLNISDDDGHMIVGTRQWDDGILTVLTRFDDNDKQYLDAHHVDFDGTVDEEVSIKKIYKLGGY